MTLRFPCFAKINLFLAVGPGEESGYHPVRTVFQSIGLCDQLVVSSSESDAFVCASTDVPRENTVTKALRFAREYVTLPPLRVDLQKSGWTQAGLGLGSSDAACALRAAQIFSRGQLSRDDCFEIARAVGADVSFFLVGGRAQGEGYGERLTPLPDRPKRHLVIAKPEVGVSTAEAYSMLDSQPREFLDFPVDQEGTHNDFETVMPAECVRLRETLLGAGASAARLCGSGSAVFGFFDESQVESAKQSLAADPELQVVSTVTLTRAESLAFVECG